MKLKSFFISFLSTLFLSCIGSTTAFATSITLGDVNNDGITSGDALAIQKKLLKLD
ncbi:MAG: hypothetical protein BWZ04_02389 [Firmicutes bacterium ADurb.BinA205]|nr:MAG: hypothetical protein BWZ04_02389 [Firmicutes bacterium ADurb.BinA205]